MAPSRPGKGPSTPSTNMGCGLCWITPWLRECPRHLGDVNWSDSPHSMSDLIGFEGYLNTSTPFLLEEHKVMWKTDRVYPDFNIGNEYNDTCTFPEFWFENGERTKPPLK